MHLTTALAHDLAAPAPGASRQQIMDLLADFSIETTPAAARNGGLGLLPAGLALPWVWENRRRPEVRK